MHQLPKRILCFLFILHDLFNLFAEQCLLLPDCLQLFPILRIRPGHIQHKALLLQRLLPILIPCISPQKQPLYHIHADFLFPSEHLLKFSRLPVHKAGRLPGIPLPADLIPCIRPADLFLDLRLKDLQLLLDILHQKLLVICKSIHHISIQHPRQLLHLNLSAPVHLLLKNPFCPAL